MNIFWEVDAWRASDEQLHSETTVIGSFVLQNAPCRTLQQFGVREETRWVRTLSASTYD